ncbi:TPA: hypothetical protein L4T28_006296 [Pseudomonas aeruginosa]|nr:hypothetical protein [Pseudomonas aeruginosa]
MDRVAGRPPKQLLAVSEKPDQLLAVPKSRGACRPPLDGSAIAAHRIALADPFGRLGSLACSTKRRHLDRVAGLPPKQLLAVSEEPESFAALCSYRRQKLVVIKHLYPTALRKQLAAVSEGRNSFRLFGVGR